MVVRPIGGSNPLEPGTYVNASEWPTLNDHMALGNIRELAPSELKKPEAARPHPTDGVQQTAPQPDKAAQPAARNVRAKTVAAPKKPAARASAKATARKPKARTKRS